MVVQEYEQNESDSTSRVKIDPKAEVKKEGRLVQAKLAELEKELAILREGPFGPNSEFVRSLPPDERETVLKALEKEGLLEHDEDLVDTDELDEMLENFHAGIKSTDINAVPGVTLRIPPQQKVYIKNFNNALKQSVQSTAEAQPSLNLWKWYLRCQQHVVGFPSLVPEDVWQMVWVSQTTAYYRPKHIVMLARDMLSAEQALSSPQWITYIQAIQEDGDIATAVGTWEKQRPTLGDDEVVASDFWTLGVRLYAALGRPQKAQAVAFLCLDHSSVVSPEILLPVISGWANSHAVSASEKSWACYLKLRMLLGDQMKPEIYESISRSFLHTNRADLALAVFKDMIIAEKESSDDSTAVYRTAVDHIKEVQSTAVSEELVNRISLSALTIFPKKFHNKFFFGSWIKQLIGRGDVDGAAQVVELMNERGVTLDAKHLNGIIGAWLREGSASSQRKAEQMAWAMINRRTDRVEYCIHRNQRAPKVIDNVAEKPWIPRIPRFLRRDAPPANIETFSILLMHYTRRAHLNPTHAEYLTHVMTGPAQMTPNSFIMNHWLYAALRSSDLQALWEKYTALKANITPDLETFAVLWDAAKIQYDPSRAVHVTNFPSARILFAEMSEWTRNLAGRKLASVQEEFSKDMYNQIIRCFCLSSDLPGTLCALHGLAQLFDAYPDDDTTRMIMIQVARILPRDPSHKGTGRRASRLRVSHQKKPMAHVAGILEMITEQQGLQFVERGFNPDELNPTSGEAKRYRSDVLTQFLVNIMERTKKMHSLTGRGGDVPNEVRTVAKVMGVGLADIHFGSVVEEGSESGPSVGDSPV